MEKEKLLNIILDLPTDQQLIIAEAILQSLHRRDTNIDKDWVKEVDQRLQRFKEGNSKIIPGEEVFKKAQKIITP